MSKPSKNEELRGRLAEILIEWNMPTRQAAIGEIVHLIQAELDRQKNELLDELAKWVAYNKHDMGEIGEFIRTQYIYNFIAAHRIADKNETL